MIQEVELKVLPLPKLRFIYIIEVAFELLFGLRNPKTTVLGMTPYCYVLADVADRLGPGGGFLRCQRIPNALGNDERGSIGNLCTMTLVESTMAERQQATYAQCH